MWRFYAAFSRHRPRRRADGHGEKCEPVRGFENIGDAGTRGQGHCVEVNAEPISELLARSDPVKTPC